MLLRRRTDRILTAALAAAALLAAPTLAQDKPAPKPPEPPKVSIEAKDANVRDVLEKIFKGAKIKDYSIAADVNGWVTIRLTDRPFEEALNLVARAANPPLTWTKTEGVYEVRVRRPRRLAAGEETPPTLPGAIASAPVVADSGVRYEVIRMNYLDARDVVQILGMLRPENLTAAIGYVPNNQVLTRWGGPDTGFVSGIIEGRMNQMGAFGNPFGGNQGFGGFGGQFGGGFGGNQGFGQGTGGFPGQGGFTPPPNSGGGSPPPGSSGGG